VTWAMAIGFGSHHIGQWVSDATALSTLSDRYVNHGFATFLDIVVVVDAFVAALAGVQLTARTLFALGRDRGIPTLFSLTTPRFKSPFVGITISVLLTLVLGATLGRHYGVFTYFAMMATTGSLGILFVYVLVALSGMVYFWRLRNRQTHAYNVLLDLVLPVGAVAICGYTIYSSITPAPPAPISYSVWIALAWLVAGLVVVGVLLATRPDAVKKFGRAFVSAHGDDGAGVTAPAATTPPLVDAQG